jgi:glutamate--cysteine ligase
MIPFLFEEGMGFERWVDYALDVPLYFVKRGDDYIDVAGDSFRDLLAGRPKSMQGERATLSDWSNHLTTIFPEVRLKRYIEMRGADSGPWRRLPALPALWVGLLYDEDALDAAWDLVKDWTAEERQQLRDDVPRRGFSATVRNTSVLELARSCVDIARHGLARRDRNDANGCDETRYLEPIEEYIERGITPAEELLEKYHGPWRGSVEPVFTEYAY